MGHDDLGRGVVVDRGGSGDDPVGPLPGALLGLDDEDGRVGGDDDRARTTVGPSQAGGRSTTPGPACAGSRMPDTIRSPHPNVEWCHASSSVWTTTLPGVLAPNRAARVALPLELRPSTNTTRGPRSGRGCATRSANVEIGLTCQVSAGRSPGCSLTRRVLAPTQAARDLPARAWLARMGMEIVFEVHQLSEDNERGFATGWLPGEPMA